ncbi:MAG: hypothetical protein RR185_03980 [Angelakisella sp.]
MARDFAKPFYNSRLWRRCRAAYKAYRVSVDGGLCETCHDALGSIVHHKDWLTPNNVSDPDITLNFSNLKLDCVACHNKEDADERTDCYMDKHGQLQAAPPPIQHGHDPRWQPCVPLLRNTQATHDPPPANEAHEL